MLKKLFLVLIAFSVVLNAANIVRMKQVASAPTKQEAIEDAHWLMFESAIGKVLGQSSYGGSVSDSFKSDMEKDFLSFKKRHFKNDKAKCNNLGEDGYECLVLASMDLDKLKYDVSKKSNSSKTMGKSNVEGIEIVLVDEVDSKLSKRFTKEIHASSLETGSNLSVVKKGTQVGIKGNKCESIKAQREIYKRKGSAYKSALISIDKKLKDCQENKSVAYAFKLSSLEYIQNPQKDRYGSYTGELTYNISMINTQTGKEDNAVRSETVTSFAPSVNQLKSKLNKKAALKANSEMTNNILTSISKKTRKAKRKKAEKFDYYYTVILMGMTNDADDRNKRKIVKSVIKEIGAKAKKNNTESTDFEQVYNFGHNEELDLEEFGDMLYDMADSMALRIQVNQKSDDIIVVQFQ